MNTIRKVAKNSGFVIGGEVLFRIISLIVMVYLARYLGTVEFGKYNFVFSYLAFFGIISELGLSTVLVREMSRNVANVPKLIGNGYIIRLTLTILAFFLSIAFITITSYPKDTTFYVYIASVTLIFLSLSGFYSTIFQMNLRMEYPTFAKLVYKFLSAILIILVIFSHGTLMQIITILVFSEGIKTLIIYLFSRRFVRPIFEIDFELCKYLLKESLPIALSSFLVIIYFRIDVIMLSMMIGDSAVGIFSAAYNLSEPLILIPYAFMISLFPMMSSYFKSSREKLMKSYRLSTKYLLIITLPIAIGTTLIADRIILLIYGNSFIDSITALQILIWTLVFTSINYVLLNILVSMDKQKSNTLSHALCVVINVTLNFFFNPPIELHRCEYCNLSDKCSIIFIKFLLCFEAFTNTSISKYTY